MYNRERLAAVGSENSGGSSDSGCGTLSRAIYSGSTGHPAAIEQPPPPSYPPPSPPTLLPGDPASGGCYLSFNPDSDHWLFLTTRARAEEQPLYEEAPYATANEDPYGESTYGSEPEYRQRFVYPLPASLRPPKDGQAPYYCNSLPPTQQPRTHVIDR